MSVEGVPKRISIYWVNRMNTDLVCSFMSIFRKKFIDYDRIDIDGRE